MTTFRKVYLEITNVCDRACSFCAGHTRGTGFASVGDFSRLLDRLTGRVGVLHLHVMGEPLLHPDLADILSLCQRGAFRVNLVTNGWHVARCTDTLLASPALRQVSISTQSAELSTDTQLADYAKDIATFARAAAAACGPKISIRFWASDGTRERPAVRAIEHAFGVDGLVTTSLQVAESAVIAPGVWCNRAPRFEWPESSGPIRSTRGTCLGLRGQMAVLVDGTVVPCCLDRNGLMGLGNLLNTPLDTILTSPRARALREGFARGEISEELCRRCAYRERFGDDGSGERAREE